MIKEEEGKTLLQNMIEAVYFAELLKHETSVIVELEKVCTGHEDDKAEFYGHVGNVSLCMQNTVKALAALIECKTKHV